MWNVCLVLLVVVGLLFIYYVFFAKKDTSKEKMENKKRIINYNTEWCGYSKRFQPVWDEFTKQMKSKYPDIDVIDMKCDREENDSKCQVPEVEGYPTVVFYSDKPYVFSGSRNPEELLKFVEEHK